MIEKDLSVTLSQLVGSTLVFLISEHWLAKKALNRSDFSLESAINLFSWKIGGIQNVYDNFNSLKFFRKIKRSAIVLDVFLSVFSYLRKLVHLKYSKIVDLRM